MEFKLKGVCRLRIPLSRGKACSSTSWELRYRELPCDFFVFFLSERFANGSMRSTNVPDIVAKDTPAPLGK